MSYPYTPESLPSPGSDSGSEDDTMRLLLEATEQLSIGPTITRAEVLNDIAGLRHALDGMTKALHPLTGWIRQSEGPIYKTYRAIHTMLQSAMDEADPSGDSVMRPYLLDDPELWDGQKTVDLAKALITAPHEDIRGQMVDTLEFVGNLYAPSGTRHKDHILNLLRAERVAEMTRGEQHEYCEAVARDGAESRASEADDVCLEGGDTNDLVEEMREFQEDEEYYRGQAEKSERTCRVLREAVELLTRG